ncbi:hypothetical protein BGZ95_009736 [Linnemannia exigua]|uniref:Pinin/SDK/MemA protein domain-containing protein n=1 Tax=Linnemannia exigua TaxID=604196 RepID=A0AAD4H7M6_9FUNG|nr:hypothetical protein BGZ95_009736 [Linnemannia exigua]
MSSNRIVSSTIIRPAVDAEDDNHRRSNDNSTQRRKREFPDAPEPARRRRSFSRSRSRSRSPLGLSSQGQGGQEGVKRPSLESASDAFRRRSSGPVGGGGGGPSTIDRLGDTPATTTATSTTATTPEVLESGSGATNAGVAKEGDDHGARAAVKRTRTANVNEDDTRRGKRMMGMILGTLTQFKRQQVVPRPVPSVNANASANASNAAAAAAAAAASTSASAINVTTRMTTARTTETMRRDGGDRVRGRSSERAGGPPPRDNRTREPRDARPRNPRDELPREPRDTRARSPAPRARSPATAAIVDSGLRNRGTVQERVQEKLRLETEENEERIRKERAGREARLRETLLKQIAGRSSVPGRRRGPLGAAGTSSLPSAIGASVHASSRATRYDKGYLMTETRPRLRYMPKVMNATIQKEYERQVESNPDQRAFGARHNNAPKPRRDVSGDSLMSQSRTRDGEDDEKDGRRHEDEDIDDEDEDAPPSAEAVAKAEAEAARELEDGMDLDLEGSSFATDSSQGEVLQQEERVQSGGGGGVATVESGSSSVTVPGSPDDSGRGELSEDVTME